MGTKLITKEFAAANAIAFMGFCNLSLFFQFFSYLHSLPIPAEWYGFLIGVFSVPVMVLRPIVAMLVTPANARRWISVSCLCVGLSLVAYHLGLGLWSMTAVRVLHGTAYVILSTAVLSALVAAIPPDRSAQAFGLASVIMLLPYALVPPLLEPMISRFGSFLYCLDIFAILTVACIPLAGYIAKHGGDESSGSAPARITWADLVDNLRSRRLSWLFGLNMIMWTAFAPVFFFLEKHGESLGIANPGWFFTLSAFTEIGVRIAAGSRLDKLNKSTVMVVSLLWLAAGYIIMAFVKQEALFIAMGLYLGLGWGVAVPLLSSLVFDNSHSRYRALNANLAVEMYQAGMFIGPTVGAALMLGQGYASMYIACAAVLLIGAAGETLAGRRKASP